MPRLHFRNSCLILPAIGSSLFGCAHAQTTTTTAANSSPTKAPTLLAQNPIAGGAMANAPLSNLRPPSVPLVAHDPYFSVWSKSDNLTDSDTNHWTGKKQSLSALTRIDGQTFRLMGTQPTAAPALTQTSVNVFPTRTVYEFKNDAVALTLTFITPSLPEDIEILARPVSYITFDVTSLDGKAHAVQLYFDAAGELAVDTLDQKIEWSRPSVPGITALSLGTVDQPILAKKGDDRRIDWGHLYVAVPQNTGGVAALGSRASLQQTFSQNGKLPTADDTNKPRAADDATPVGAIAFDLGKVGNTAASKVLMLAYDDEYSLTYMNHKLRPYWRRNGMTAPQLLAAAAKDFPALQKRCAAFDTELMDDLTKVAGVKFARITALAHRQALAAQKVVADANGAPLSFSKENFSNGCIATVDLIYPAAPQLLLLSPTLTKASLVTELNYAASPRWKFPFAPHDLGTYPRADGQVYGGGERTEENQMPVEETGNMMLVTAAVAKIDGNAKFAEPYWPTLKKWAAYLEEKGFDPENQLCTDDFAGHLAHNVNLSAKAIEALGAYAMLCDMRGDKTEGTRVREVAKGMAKRWVEEGKDGNHYKLAFDQKNTWSQKYNLAWDRILGLNLFPDSVMQEEMAYYKTKLNAYGVPLDNRRTYTKLDWTLWTATLTGNNKADMEALIDPVYAFVDGTPDRVPMTDWYETTNAKQVGFQARSAIGGVFMPALGDAAIWKKWASRDKTNNPAKPFNWAPLPKPPIVTAVVPTSQDEAQTWRYTTDAPAAGWTTPTFDDSGWKAGPGGLGTRDTPGTSVRTTWNSGDIWARRTFDLPAGDTSELQLWLYHDEDAEVYINGVLAVSATGYNTSYDAFPISAAARATLKPGKNTFAVHCHQTGGGQYIDVGLATVKEQN